MHVEGLGGQGEAARDGKPLACRGGAVLGLGLDEGELFFGLVAPAHGSGRSDGIGRRLA
jgi:hypothetical protein